MNTLDFDALSALIEIIRCGSFRAAAAQRGVTPSALSHSITKLERALGVRLLIRTTRAVALTEAGEHLIACAGPAFDDIAAAVEKLNTLRDTPAGRLRITVPRMAATTVLLQALPSFIRAYPAIQLEVSVADGFQDLAAHGFDAGIRLGEALKPNMVAVPVGAPVSMAVVAAPSYLNTHEPILTPNDLRHHACIGLRLIASGTIYSWEFERSKRPLNVDVTGSLIMDDQELIVSAAKEGMGVAYTALNYVESDIATGRLCRILADWMPPEQHFFLYYPSRKNMPAALRALVNHLRYKKE